jgi:hypothetical protein
LALRQKAKLIAPELLVAECVNVLWKKVRSNELLKAEALLAACLLQGAEFERVHPNEEVLRECLREVCAETNAPTTSWLRSKLRIVKAPSIVPDDDDSTS